MRRRQLISFLSLFLVLTFSGTGLAVDYCSGLYSPGNDFLCGPHSKGEGNCTWYARYKRPEVDGKCTGNASVWYSQAEKGKLAVGSKPTKGSIAVFRSWMMLDGVNQNVGHVAYVESVNANSSFNVSEMGWDTWNGVHTDTYSAGDFSGIIGFIYPVGVYSDGFHADDTSQAFLDAYNRFSGKLGWPNDNGGGVFVHKWASTAHPSYRVWLQDFVDSSNKHTALILNEYMGDNKAYKIQEGFRDLYMSGDGPYNYGMPFTDEKTSYYANSPDSTSGDIFQPGDYVTVQKFRRIYEDNGQLIYGNERRTMVWKWGINPQNFAAGEFAIYSAQASCLSCFHNGDQVYVINNNSPMNPASDKPWPLAGVTIQNGTTGKWFTKPGFYNFVLHNPDGSRKAGTGLSVLIAQGNSQSAGDYVDETGIPVDASEPLPALDEPAIYPPENISSVFANTTRIDLAWNRGLNPPGTYQYQVELGGNVIQTVNQESHSIIGLSPGTDYTVRIKTVSNGVTSGFSPSVLVSTKSNTVPIPGQIGSLSTTISKSFYENDPSIETNFFYNDDEYVFAWLKLVNVIGNLQMDFYFYDPNGNLVSTDSETRNYSSTVPSVNIMGEMNAFKGTHELGQWRVEYYINGEYYASDYFTVGVFITNITSFNLLDTGSTIASLSWTACTNAWTYLIYRDGILVAETGGLSYVDTGLEPSTTYAYKIVPKAGSVVSLFYSELNATTRALSYTSGGSGISENWKHGSDNINESAYWDLQTVNPRTEFSEGASVCSVSKISGITADHRWKTEFYRDTEIVWTDESPWLYVGAGWDYSSAVPILSNAQAGEYEAKVWLDTGHGYELFSQKQFTVYSDDVDYVYAGSQVCENWVNGSTDQNASNYWDLQAVNPGTVYEVGNRVYLLAQAENTSLNHEWKVEIYHEGVFQWQHLSGIQDLNGGTWAYSNFAPYIDNVQAGIYEMRVFLRTSGDFVYLDSKNFYVNPEPISAMPYQANFELSDFDFFLEDNTGLNYGNIALVNLDGRNCLELENSGPADASWKLQAKKVGFQFVSSTSYSGSIWLKGETAGTVYAAIEKNTDPWNNLGMWKALNVTTSWQEYDLDFTFAGGANPEDVRLTIQFGGYQGKLWTDDVIFE